MGSSASSQHFDEISCIINRTRKGNSAYPTPQKTELDFRVCTKRMFSQFSEKRKQLYANSFFKFGFISRFCLKAFVYAAFALPETD